jgi:beta-glucanase (GH16 family)
MKQNIIILFSLLIFLSACSRKIIPSSSDNHYQFEKIPAWVEDFNGTILDTTIWTMHNPEVRHDGYNDTTSFGLDGAGNFVNKVYSDTVNGKVTHHAGMIRTKQLFQYGRFEASVSFVNSSGSWSAFWMQTPSMANPIGNPQAAGMEIDIIETLHNDGAAYENLHWDGYGADHKHAGNKTGNLGVNSGKFHIYALEWTPDYYKFYVDGKLMWTYSKNVSRRSEFIILSSEIRNFTDGSWAGLIPATGFGTRNNTTTVMKVDYVKWYKLKPGN